MNQQQQQQQLNSPRAVAPTAGAVSKESDVFDLDGTNSSASDNNNDDSGGNSSDSDMAEVDSMLTANCNQEREGFLTVTPGTETIPQTIIPFTPVQFFYMFLSDKSEEFERSVKCLTPRLSLEIDPWKVSSEHNGMMVREMRSTVSLVELKAPVGPDKSRVVETQRYILTKDMLILQIRSFSLDIPYNDCFHTESEWIFTKVSPSSSSLVGKGCAVWVKRSIIKSLIEATTIKQMRGQTSSYIEQTKKWGEDKKELLDRIERRISNGGRKGRKHRSSSSSSSSSAAVAVVSGDVVQSSSSSAQFNMAKGSENVVKTAQLTSVATGSQSGRTKNHILIIALMCLVLFYLVSRVTSLEKKLDKVASLMAAQNGNGNHEL